jgi:hypothetical protein
MCLSYKKAFLLRRLPAVLCVFFTLGLLGSDIRGRQAEITRVTLSPLRMYRISVPANVDWTDTGFDVRSGQFLHFSASGSVTLQQGNPIAFCGPEGLDMTTVQQPLKDYNYGALVGKIVLTLSVEIDEETGEEIRDELIEYFYIGSEASVMIPLDGSLYLGLNELVVADNAGSITVEYEMKQRQSFSSWPWPLF